MNSPDYRCYFVTGGAPARDVVHIATQAALGGAGIIQVRSKPISARDLFALTEQVATAVAHANPDTRVLVDDRVDVYLALKAAGSPVHGVHLGQDDLPVKWARQLIGPDAILGLTTGTRELILDANAQAKHLDYVGCGPFRATPTKDSGRTPIGLAGYEELVPVSQLPVVAIGDVTAQDVPELAATGVAGVAVVRGIMNAPDPGAYCQEILQGFKP
ncbi:thiamine-phosphate pyrophosphorylase [Corynebacterium phocae]|uniref:Thiamine-phosphate synthase n=1 Tax=Corynebacterium phocae TaxID=161895 RepID=A0A1L7D2K9_9CORY|nr:thiamine phosphate synthase [Corynebacterium phocae]APT92307.1 thiamine-phosphate pyrophosphorylase [Corynebacterium phocae]KAA8725342.1 thiamine phosphate synthase [Corynebacterium phocae]